MEHSSHSPDLAPSDFWLFTKIKSALKGQRDFRVLKTSNDTKSYSTTGVPKMFPTVEHCWAKCTAVQGEYFKGNLSQ
jgi:hypothetical protein